MLLKIMPGNKSRLVGRIPTGLALVYKQLEGRKRWASGELEFESSGHNFALVEKFVTKKMLVEPPKAARKGMKAFYAPRTKPYDHQARAEIEMGDSRFFALFMEQGTGKTKVSLDYAGRCWAMGDVTGLLVVSKKGAHRQWAEEEARVHYGAPYASAFWNGKAMEVAVKSSVPGSLEIATINYDALKYPGGWGAALAFCERHDGSLLIVADESQDIKNAGSDRHDALSKLKKYSCRRLLSTGTPLAKDLTDEWAQLLWLDESILGIKYKTTFRREYCIMGGFEGRAVIGHRNVEKFKAITAPHIFRATKDEIGILPKQYNRWRFDLLPKQKQLIAELKKELSAVIDGFEVEVSNAASLFGKFQQIASGFLILGEDQVTDIVPLLKNPRLIAAFEWFDAGEGKAIMWARYKLDVAMLAEVARRKGIEALTYDGGTRDKDRKVARDRFNEDPTMQLLIANPAAAGTGLNLQKSGCNRNLYYSNSFSAIDRWQSEDRVHRIGTAGSVVYTDLVAHGSLDGYILSNLRRKKSLSDLVLNRDSARAMLRVINEEDLPDDELPQDDFNPNNADSGSMQYFENNWPTEQDGGGR